ncbi:MAG: hypothetical protein KKF10_03740 [Verrucomicrobia bacterium]|nr:hypothetical protein [Verrucomicrobiota bacterium]
MRKFKSLSYLRFCIGVLLIPCGIALTRTVVASIGASAALSLTGGAWPFLMVAVGVVAAAFVFWALPAPVRLYVLAHELTHALWGALLGARISGLRVSGSGGYVKLSQSNWLIALAPYFFPLYTFIVILAYYILLIFFDLRPYAFAWLGLIGLTLGFHFVFTIYALAQDQQDVRDYGRVFSFGMIYLINMLGVCLVLLIVAPLTLPDLIRRLAGDQAVVWSVCGRALMAAGTWVWGRLSGT